MVLVDILAHLVATGARSYRGQDAQARAADRRRRLLDAALELFGTRGYAATRIQDVCATSGVTARHFYEAFPGREELLAAVYADVVEGHLAEVAAALAGDPEDPLRAGLDAALGAWTRDERRARLAFVEVVGVSPALEERRFAVLEGYAAFIAGELARVSDADAAAFTWAGRALVGAAVQTFQSWRALPIADRPPLATLADELTPLFAAPLARRRDRGDSPLSRAPRGGRPRP